MDPETTIPEGSSKVQTPTTTATTPRYKRPNYNAIHACPLPIATYPLPPLILHNPLSLLTFLYAYLFSPPSQPAPLYTATFHAETRSVHVTDPTSIRAFWNNGFFGKGSLSRSEPTWVIRRRRALGVIGRDEALTAEEVTERRRGERKEFKKERARVERERLAKQLAEEGKIVAAADSVVVAEGEEGNGMSVEEGEKMRKKKDEDESGGGSASRSENGKSVHFAPVEMPARSSIEQQQMEVEIQDLEHLQLTLEEAFFLSFALGVLKITDAKTQKTISPTSLLPLFRTYSYFPPLPLQTPHHHPDDPFTLSYVVYHHFRSLGWVVKPGIKFAVDYLLYNRGPVFSHAEFAILILPAYSHPHWTNDAERKKKERRPWHWLQCVNRVSAQVKKTVVLVYVEVPPPLTQEMGVGEMLARYRIREVGLRRWLVSRNRD